MYWTEELLLSLDAPVEDPPDELVPELREIVLEKPDAEDDPFPSDLASELDACLGA